MARLINADNLKERILAFAAACKTTFLSIEAIIDRIDTETTVDAVEVVRCKDCRHFTKKYNCCELQEYRSPIPFVMEDDFCPDGERRTDD